MTMKYRIFDKINNWLYQVDEFDERFAIQCNGTVGRFNGKMYDTCTNDVIVEMWTGRRDDNGELIYDGDIVIDINGNKFEVQWNDDTCKWQLSDGSDLNDGDNYGRLYYVVGHIHEPSDTTHPPAKNEQG